MSRVSGLFARLSRFATPGAPAPAPRMDGEELGRAIASILKGGSRAQSALDADLTSGATSWSGWRRIAGSPPSPGEAFDGAPALAAAHYLARLLPADDAAANGPGAVHDLWRDAAIRLATVGRVPDAPDKAAGRLLADGSALARIAAAVEASVEPAVAAELWMQAQRARPTVHGLRRIARHAVKSGAIVDLATRGGDIWAGPVEAASTAEALALLAVAALRRDEGQASRMLDLIRRQGLKYKPDHFFGLPAAGEGWLAPWSAARLLRRRATGDELTPFRSRALEQVADLPVGHALTLVCLYPEATMPLADGLADRVTELRDLLASLPAATRIRLGDEEFRPVHELAAAMIGAAARAAVAAQPSAPVGAEAPRPQPAAPRREAAPEAGLDTIRAAYSESRYAESLAAARRAIDAGVSDVAVWRYAILSAGRLHRFDLGRELFEDAAARLPSHPTALIQKSVLAWEAGLSEVSHGYLVDAVRAAPASPDVWRALAEQFGRVGNLPQALAAWDKARELGLGGDSGKRRAALLRAATALNLEAGAPSASPDAIRGALNQTKDEPFQGALLASLLQVAPPPRPRRAGPQALAVCGMHFGFGGAPQKAMRFTHALREDLPDNPVTFFCRERRNDDADAVVEKFRAAAIETVVYGDLEPGRVPEEARAVFDLIEPPRRRRSVAALAAALAERRIDVLHAMGTNDVLIEAALAGAIAGVPRIVLNAGMMRPEVYAKKDQGIIEARVYRSFYRAMVDLAPRFIIANNSLAAAADYADWLGVSPHRIAVIYNGVEPPDVGLSRDAARERLSIAADEEMVIVVGRLAHEKRPDVVIDAVERLARTRKRLKVVFVGDGPYEAVVRGMVAERNLSDHVRLDGFRADIATYYAAADLCVLVSEGEGLPNVVLEAQAIGLPVVATNAGGAREAMLPGLTGDIVPAVDARAIARSIDAALDRVQRAGFDARIARARTSRLFSMPAMVRRSRWLYDAGGDGLSSVQARVAFRIARTDDLPFDAPSVETAALDALGAGRFDAAAWLARAVLRRAPGSLKAWRSLLHAARGVGALPARKPRYLALADRLLAQGRLSPDTHEAILDLAGAQDRLARSGIGPKAAAEASVVAAIWSRLAPDARLRGRFRQEALLVERLRTAGAPVRDGWSAFANWALHMLGPDRPRATGRRLDNAPVCIWVGSLALGGGERQVLNLVRLLLARTSLSIDLLVTSATTGESAAYQIEGGDRLSTTVLDALPDEPGPTIAAAGDALADGLDLPAAAQLCKAIRFFERTKPAVVHLRGVTENALAVAVAARLAGAPKIIINVGTMRQAAQADGTRAYDVACDSNAAVLRRLAGCDGVGFAFNSAAARDDWTDLLGLHPGRTTVIRNGFDPRSLAGDLAPDVATAAARIADARRAGARVVGGVFRLHPVKDPLLWMRVVARVAEARGDALFVLAGDGRLLPDLRALADIAGLADRVIFLGAVNSGLAHIYALFDVLLVTSRIESSPNVAVEALAAGVPVVAPRVGGIAESIPPALASLMPPARDAASLAECVLKALDDPDLAAAARDLGPRLATGDFDPRRGFENFLALYAAGGGTPGSGA